MTWITYATVLGSRTYWTDVSGGCAQVRSCANRVAPYTTVYECATETTGYRAITTIYNLTWESTPDPHGPCERTYVQATAPNIVAPSLEFLASVSVMTH